jgi:membrane protein YqaA with SNARE-associated domain
MKMGIASASLLVLFGLAITALLGATLFSVGSEAFRLGGTQTPEPSTILLVGSGILGLVSVLRRRMLDR